MLHNDMHFFFFFKQGDSPLREQSRGSALCTYFSGYPLEGARLFLLQEWEWSKTLEQTYGRTRARGRLLELISTHTLPFAFPGAGAEISEPQGVLRSYLTRQINAIWRNPGSSQDPARVSASPREVTEISEPVPFSLSYALLFLQISTS